MKREIILSSNLKSKRFRETFRMWEVPGLNSGCTPRYFRGFSECRQITTNTVLENRPRPLPSKSSLVVFTHDAV